MGAAARLMLAREIPRSDTNAQAQSRLAEEVPVTAMLQAAQALDRKTKNRLADEARRLREYFPYRES